MAVAPEDCASWLLSRWVAPVAAPEGALSLVAASLQPAAGATPGGQPKIAELAKLVSLLPSTLEG